VRIIDLLIQSSGGNKKVKGSLKGLLGIVEDCVKTIPAGGPQCAGRIHETRKGHGHHLVGGIVQGHLVHLICVGVIQVLVVPDATTEPTDTAEIGLHICAPLSLGP